MKIGAIIIKLFIPVLFVLIVIQLYLFVSLNSFEMSKISPERDQNRVVKIQMLKALIEEKIQPENGVAQSNEDLRRIILEASMLYDADIWIENSDGAIILDSFTTGKRPAIVRAGFNKVEIYDDVNVSHLFQDNLHAIYTDVFLDNPNEKQMSLHILYESEKKHYRSQFLMGLARIVLIMTVLAFSFFWAIKSKVTKFQASVTKIANGDLSHRVLIDGKGFIGKLGRSFNRMTDKLEKMIASSKEITANVSHEIRTPLTRIRAVVDLMEKKFDRGEFLGYERQLKQIIDDIQILDRLVGSLLDFIKLDIVESAPEYEFFIPSDLIDDLLIRFQPVIDVKKLNIEREYSSAIIKSDRYALTTVFLNILDNATKYTPERGNIAIKTNSIKDILEANMTNSFYNSNQMDLDKIFCPFERASGSDTPGSGLGLAITKKIIGNLGGEITASNSEENFGIRIVLPSGLKRN